MRKLKLLIILPLILITIFTSSCVAQTFEEEINVVFMYDDEFIDHGVITQFKNYKTPNLPDSYIPDGYKFFGWTPLEPNKVKATDKNFKEEYIGAGKMVHWKDVEEYKANSTVICKALLIDKESIPHDYHFAVIAWYDKVATSFFDQDLIDKVSAALFNYLRGQGVSEEDINSIVFRGYTGNVGTSCGAIMDDDDVDLMLGWSSVSNVTGTGGMKESMIKDTYTFSVTETNNRTVHRLGDQESVIQIFEWFKTDDFHNIVYR